MLKLNNKLLVTFNKSASGNIFIFCFFFKELQSSQAVSTRSHMESPSSHHSWIRRFHPESFCSEAAGLNFWNRSGTFMHVAAQRLVIKHVLLERIIVIFLVFTSCKCFSIYNFHCYWRSQWDSLVLDKMRNMTWETVSDDIVVFSLF